MMMVHQRTANHVTFNVKIAMAQLIHAPHVPKGVLEACKEIYVFAIKDITNLIQSFADNVTLHVKLVMVPLPQTV